MDTKRDSADRADSVVLEELLDLELAAMRELFPSRGDRNKGANGGGGVIEAELALLEDKEEA